MKRLALWMLTGLLALTAGQSCPGLGPIFGELPVQTRFSVINFSQRFYAVIGIREHRPGEDANPYSYTDLTAPGVTVRADFDVVAESGCPNAIDLRLLLYRRTNEDMPIGLDETIEPAPIVAGEVLNVPVCSIQVLETFTIVNWDAPEGTGRVKLAQCSEIDQWLTTGGPFDNALGVWEIVGVDPALAGAAPPSLADTSPITGRVVLSNGTGISGILVTVSPRWRDALDCGDPDNADDTGYGGPIAYDVTGTNGSFSIDRPAGVYRIELYGDGYAFRPAIIDVETPQQSMILLAEPVP